MTSDWFRCILVVVLNIAKVFAENDRMKKKKTGIIKKKYNEKKKFPTKNTVKRKLDEK